MEATVPTTECASDSNGPTDALRAVKLDPAVLDAQIHVYDTKAKSPTPEPSKETESANGSTLKFEEMVKMQEAALLSLAPQQLNLLMKYAGILRTQRLINQKLLECAFCKKNGEPTSWYSSHMLKDSRGRVRCPVLRGYRCPACGATGDYAHTIKYCPENLCRDRWRSLWSR